MEDPIYSGVDDDVADHIAETLETIVKTLVADREDEVGVSWRDGQSRTTFIVKAAQDDLGKVIGRDGRMAQALRTILSATSKKHSRKFDVRIDSGVRPGEE
ncbi:MAG: KH domain-containing protein [Candidatus Thorarchaeota archaeon]|jgi:predicted RNA-binding protein YlqC (UPF0109 family)